MKSAVFSLSSIFTDMRQALLTRTGKNTQWVFAGEAATAIMGFLINVLLLRRMSVDDYGLFSLFFSIMMLLSGFAHLGWTETYVRFGARYQEKPEFGAIRSHAFRAAITGVVAIGILSAILAPWICSQLIKRPDFVNYVRLAALGSVITALFSLVQNDHRVHQNFRSLVIGRVGSSAFRLSFGILAVAVGMITLPTVSAIYLLSPVLFVVGPLWHWFHYGTREKVDPALKREMGGYNGWLFVSFFTVTIIGNVDSQVLAHYHDNQTLSAFSAAGKLTLPIQMIVMAMTTTLLPRLSAAKHPSEIRYYLNRVILFLIPLVLLMLLAVWFAPPVLIWLAGDAYRGITTLLRLQILMTTVMLITNPIGLIISAWGWSRLLALMNFAQLAVDIALDLLWIPKHGAVGAVMATLVVNVIGTLTVYLAVVYGLRKQEKGA